jgi:hypothetical protein
MQYQLEYRTASPAAGSAPPCEEHLLQFRDVSHQKLFKPQNPLHQIKNGSSSPESIQSDTQQLLLTRKLLQIHNSSSIYRTSNTRHRQLFSPRMSCAGSRMAHPAPGSAPPDLEHSSSSRISSTRYRTLLQHQVQLHQI